MDFTVDSRTSVIVDIAKSNYPQPPEYRFARKLTGAPRLHLMTPPQEMAYAFIDVVVHRSRRGTKTERERREARGVKAMRWISSLRENPVPHRSRLLVAPTDLTDAQ